MDLREIIEQAHMAGQKNAGVDPDYSNARAYCFEVLFGTYVDGVKPTLSEVLAEMKEKGRKQNGATVLEIEIDTMKQILSKYFA